MRIHRYEIDTVITPNDKVLGTDGDDTLLATKNFSMLALLAYLGTNYNLQSADLVYNYTDNSEDTLDSGTFTSNNRLDSPINMADLTTLYVSKTTLFGQNVEAYIETIGASAFSFMLYDFSDYNQFAACDIVSVVDHDADTLAITVTVISSNGVITDDNTFGLKTYPSLGSVGDNLGDHTATQTLNMNNNFIDDAARLEIRNSADTNQVRQYFASSTLFYIDPIGESSQLYYDFNANEWVCLGTANFAGPHFKIEGSTPRLQMLPYGTVPFSISDSQHSGVLFNSDGNPQFFNSVQNNSNNLVLDYTDFTLKRTANFPDKDGTIAYLDDVVSKWISTKSTPTTTSGTTSTSAVSISIPAGTLATNGDLVEFEYFCTSTGATNSNAVSVTVGITGDTVSSGALSSVTGSLYYKVKGLLQRVTSTTFNIFLEFSHGFSHTQVGAVGSTLNTGNWDSNNQTFTVDIRDTNGNDDFTLENGHIKSATQ